MAFKFINGASTALLVLVTLVATGAADFNNENGNYNDLVCKNSNNPTKAMELTIKDMLNITKNTRVTLNANKHTSKTAETCAKAYKNAEFEIKQVREILKSKDFRALKAYISAASLQYTKCGEIMAHHNETGIIASKNEELVKRANFLSGLSSGKPCGV